jgi:hypothetical protein
MIKTASQLIDALGGTSAVADAFGVQDNTISTWRTRGFPAWACIRFREAALALALKVDDRLFETKSRAKSAA